MPARFSPRPLRGRAGAIALRALLLGFGLAVALLLLEVGLRAYFAARVGREVLLYGTSYCCGPKTRLAFDPKGGGEQLIEDSHSVHEAGVRTGSYWRYRPGETKSDYTVDGESFAVRINNHGFRGEDFRVAKPTGTLRVVALGASSTFGYRSRDDETYPVYVEALLNERLREEGCGPVERVEVINLGIPHQWSESILATFREEGIRLSPDVVTLYTGMNDAKPGWGPRKRPGEYELEWNHNAYRTKPLPVRFAMDVYHEVVVQRLRGALITAALVDNLVNLEWTTFPGRILPDYARHKVEEFIENVDGMRRVARENGAVFIVANQQAHHSDLERPRPGVSYQEEQRRLEAKRAAGEGLRVRELEFLTHGRLMRELRAWSRRHGVPFVDAIGATNRKRNLMASYVHLTPEANRLVARAFAEGIWERTCGSPRWLDQRARPTERASAAPAAEPDAAAGEPRRAR